MSQTTSSPNNKNKGWPLWVKYQAQFASLQKREKYSTLFVGLFIVIYLGLWFVIFPQQDEVANIRSKHNTTLQELQQINAQLSMLNQALNYDYTKVLRGQIAQTRDELAEINNQLNSFSQGFVAAKNVPAVLKDLLVDSSDVKVSSFNVKPARAIDVEKLGEHDTQTLFFEHQMVVTLQGSYFSLQKYLAALKNNQDKLLIQEFSYQVLEYPQAELTLQIATVSANEKFIAL
ncbi:MULTISPECIES: agglutinin biogenesis protein MshJ [Pseudoalteromonas]|uniref:agglutinin biogenesis protein MshJ n=1 Tax=Pseudoalteromonas TaxID=53246 RepID=UPI000C3210FB|nr:MULTISPECIES: agglutinin biogenesis protein MshJ [Pseudoalteromonas]MBG9999136.1 agglutinin biogenesis protein MshJ [Pseudoalteromonas sp. NSLLW24]PKG63563.1 agglutinin biogenesis protein MshJ [Pseudoalteromonas arctica]PKG68529.1 agglutinin biogenesis protein MshJ [Pseudoalteromonas sp. GutCa3]